MDIFCGNRDRRRVCCLKGTHGQDDAGKVKTPFGVKMRYVFRFNGYGLE